METYPTYPQNVSRLPVRILNDLVQQNRLEPLPIDGDSALPIKRALREILEQRQWPRSQAAWNKLAQNTGNTTAQ
jgi:hypothetical protein